VVVVPLAVVATTSTLYVAPPPVAGMSCGVVGGVRVTVNEQVAPAAIALLQSALTEKRPASEAPSATTAKLESNAAVCRVSAELATSPVLVMVSVFVTGVTGT